jgi:hypothetical protein
MEGDLPAVVIATGVKFSQQYPPSMLWSHKNAVGLHCM